MIFFYCLRFGAPLRIAPQEFWVLAGPTETEPSYDMLVVNRSRETYVCRGQARLGLTTPVFTPLSVAPPHHPGASASLAHLWMQIQPLSCFLTLHM